MLIGDPTDFAIEVMSEPHLVAPSAVWGRMRIHVGDLKLGDFSDAHCALDPSYRHFESLTCDHVPLWDNSFNGLTLEQIHDLVRHAIYGDDDRTISAVRNDARRYGRYDFLTNWGEQFDGYASVIVQRDWNTVTVMHKPSQDGPPHRRLGGDFLIADCTYAGFIGAANQLVRWFDAETKRLTLEEAEPSDAPKSPASGFSNGSSSPATG